MDVSADADKSQTKTDKLEAKLQNVADKIAKFKENVTKLKEKRQRAVDAGNDDRVLQIDEKLAKQNAKLDKLEAKHAKIKAKLSDKKDQISTKHLLEKTQNRISTLQAKIEQAESNGNSDRVKMLSEKLDRSQKRHAQLTDRLHSQYSQDDENAVITGYAVSDTATAFDVAESFVSFDDTTLHMQVNVETMKNSPGIAISTSL